MLTRWLGLFVVALGWSAAPVGSAEAARVQRVSVSTAGAQSNEAPDFGGGTAQISPDGRYVVFVSGATNLWARDGNSAETGGHDVFLRDRALGTTDLVSQSSGGEPGNAGSFQPFVTWDGRYVFFQSSATNLVAPETPLYQLNLYVRDRLLHTTALVPLTSTGAAPDDDYMVNDITPDGRYLLFSTRASNVLPGDTNGDYDAFLRDRVPGTTEYVGLTNAGEQFAMSQGAAITPEGRYVLISAGSSGLLVRDRLLATNARVDLGSTGLPARDLGGGQLGSKPHRPLCRLLLAR